MLSLYYGITRRQRNRPPAGSRPRFALGERARPVPVGDLRQQILRIRPERDLSRREGHHRRDGARDVGFVIDDKIIVSNIIPDRQDEIDAYGDIYRRIHYKNIYNLPETVHVEGGDVVLYNDIIFLGQYDFLDYPSVKTARTNRLALDYLNMIFPGKTIIPLNLRKSDTNPYEGILHLDCTFMPVGRGKAILYRDGFMNPRDADHLVDLFGPENVFELTKEEMYWMNSNIFSISEDVVVTEEHFTRLNKHLREAWGMTVETVPYREISKMGGLLRCSTLPLRRD